MNLSLTQLRLRSGYMFIERDKPDSMHKMLHIPDVAQRMSVRGFCCLHEPATIDGDLTGRYVYMEKWAGTEVVIEGRELLLIKEGSCLAYEGEELMTKKELLRDITTEVDACVKHSNDLNSDDVDNVEVACNNVVGAARDEAEDGGEDEDEEKDE